MGKIKLRRRKIESTTAGVANRSIAIDRSIAEAQLVDRA